MVASERYGSGGDKNCMHVSKSVITFFAKRINFKLNLVFPLFHVEKAKSESSKREKGHREGHMVLLTYLN